MSMVYPIERVYKHPTNYILREYEDPGYEAMMVGLNERIAILKSRQRVLKTFTWIFAGALFFTLLIIILQGFSVGGFSLDTTTINLLAGATVAEIGGLLGTAFAWLYAQQRDRKETQAPS